LADGKTGDLRIGGRWLKATVFDKGAEMCRAVRMAAMRELIAEGLVTMNRPRIWRKIGDRTRTVLGKRQYKVFKTPKPKIDQNPNDSSKVDSFYSRRNRLRILIRSTIGSAWFGFGFEWKRSSGRTQVVVKSTGNRGRQRRRM